MVASWLRYRQLVRMAGVAMRSVQRIREAVYRHVLRLPMAFFDHAITGQLVSRVTNDTEAVKALYVQVLFVMLDSVIILTGAMAAMLWLQWRLMLIVAALGPAVALIVVLYQRLSAPAVTRTRELRTPIAASVSCPTQTPVSPGARDALTPKSAAARIRTSSRSRTYRCTSHRSGRRSRMG